MNFPDPKIINFREPIVMNLPSTLVFLICRSTTENTQFCSIEQSVNGSWWGRGWCWRGGMSRLRFVVMVMMQTCKSFKFILDYEKSKVCKRVSLNQTLVKVTENLLKIPKISQRYQKFAKDTEKLPKSYRKVTEKLPWNWCSWCSPWWWFAAAASRSPFPEQYCCLSS